MKNLCSPEVEKEILDRLSALKPDAPALWGKMNVAQMLCHSSDQIKMAFGEIEMKDRGSFFVKTVLKFMVLYFLKESPKKIMTLPELDQNKKGTQPADFEQDKLVLLEQIKAFGQKTERSDFYPHGAFGELNKKQWGRMIYLHLDHHFRQFGI